jgi:uncharacterized protein
MPRISNISVVWGCSILVALWMFQLTVHAQTTQSPAQAAFDSGQEALARGDQTVALKHFREAAREGHAEAAYNLGLLYTGAGDIPENKPEALKWMRMGAEKGYGPAQDSLGMWHLVGKLAPLNPAEAARWFRKAADQGSPSSMYFLGCMYARGQGVAKNPDWALTWLKHAAAKRFPVPAEYLTAEGVAKLGQGQ